MCNTKQYNKVLIGMLAFILLAQVIIIVTLIIKPSLLYYRAWEYQIDFVFRTSYSSEWHRKEYGDLSRKNLFFYNDAKVNYVSVNKDGFRRIPIEAEKYPIVVFGDSTIWGSGLGDAETLPYRLAIQLQKPVFNAARTKLSNAIKNPAIQDTEIIIEGKTERKIRGENFFQITGKENYKPLRSSPRFFDTVRAFRNIDSRRFSIFYIIPNIARRLLGDMKLLMNNKKQAPYLFLQHSMTRQDLESAVTNIKRRHEYFRKIGKRYIFIGIPAKQSVVEKPYNTDLFTKDYLELLYNRLVQVGVETIDLVGPFRKHSREILFQRYDTHWNGQGTELAAQVIVDYLTNRQVLDDEG